MSYPRSLHVLLGASVLATALSAAAQPAAPAIAPAAAAPAPSATAAPAAVPFTSALAGYRPFDDTPAANWRQANDEVGRIGGWRAYTREAQAAMADGSAPAAAGAAAADPHAGHGKH